MSGRQIFGSHFFGSIPQNIELDELIAPDTGVGSPPQGIFFTKIIDDPFLEGFPKVDHIMRDFKLGGHSIGISDGSPPTAGARTFTLLFRQRKNIHRDPDHFAALLLQECGSDGRIDSSAHGYQHCFLFHRFLTLQEYQITRRAFNG